MSEPDVEMARVFTAAFNARDVEALVACCDPTIEFHSTFAAVTRLRDGLLVYYRAYIHREDALEDLGVSEDALEPIAP